MVWYVPYRTVQYLYLQPSPKDKPSGSKHVEDLKIKNENKLQNMHFICSYCVICIYVGPHA
jgi:hypothetical protein